MNLHKFIIDESLKLIETTFDTRKWAETIGINLVENQVEIVDIVCHPKSKYINILGSRSMGKTYAIGGVSIKQCLNYPGYKVVVFGPRADQATRIISEISGICKRNKILCELVDWNNTSKQHIAFKNTSDIVALSASELSEIEGWHGDLGILDECFVYDTPITLADGSQRKIGDIVTEKKSINVLSYDIESASLVSRSVTDFKEIPLQKQMLEIELEDGQIIKCTCDHKFYTKRGWIEAQHLDKDDIKTSTSFIKHLATRKLFITDKTVYDLTVDKTHCYFANNVLVHNCHRISDVVYTQKILPMFSGSAHPKIVKIGISAYRNNFYESCHSNAWTTLTYPWYKCPLLFRGGKVTIDGVDYPKTIVDHMPLSYKKEKFPNNPELHYESISKTSEEDFDSQYEMHWVESINLFLNDTDLSLLFGDHCLLMEGQPGDTYYFGLDCAGGSEIAISDKRDKTSLTIIRKTKENVKQLCYFHEWQGSIPEQIASIIELVHPTRGKFKCAGGCGDYGNLGSAVADYLKKEIPLVGVKYAAKETVSGKNFKNAMFDQFLFELRQGRFKYPSKDLFQQDILLEEHYNQWKILEKRQSRRDSNFIIKAPPGQHDDMVNSAILALWAADRADFSKAKDTEETAGITYTFPGLVFGRGSGQNKAQGLLKQNTNFLNGFNKNKF